MSLEVLPREIPRLEQAAAGADAPAPLLRVEGLRVSVPGANGPVDAVHGVDFELRRGESLGLVGESGSGKTLTCRAILGELPGATAVSGGAVRLDGRDVAHLDAAGWRDLHSTRIGRSSRIRRRTSTRRCRSAASWRRCSA
ncbi:MAG: ATP-binding cassette domain-containing protein [Patulibacter sp.]|nr:ATP-binding cassette domain-containing protein [Patulibacter sp.]